MLRTIESQVVPVPDLLPFSPSVVHLLPSRMYSIPSRHIRLFGFAPCCKSSRLLMRARCSRSASSLNSWRLIKTGFPKDCSLRADTRIMFLWYGFSTLRRIVLVFVYIVFVESCYIAYSCFNVSVFQDLLNFIEVVLLPPASVIIVGFGDSSDSKSVQVCFGRGDPFCTVSDLGV